MSELPPELLATYLKFHGDDLRVANWLMRENNRLTALLNAEMDSNHRLADRELVLSAEVGQKDRKIEELESMLDYHVREPVDCQDPFLELGEWCASHLDSDNFNSVEPLINGLREHFRKQNSAADRQCEHGVEAGTPCMKCIQYWNPADKGRSEND